MRYTCARLRIATHPTTVETLAGNSSGVGRKPHSGTEVALPHESNTHRREGARV
jgi:hypothetical protein